MRSPALLGCVALLLAGCAGPSGTPGADGRGAVNLDVQHLGGCASDEASQRTDVVAGRAALQDLWNRSCGGGQAPGVDFAHRTVVAYFWGQKQTSGFSVEVLDATDDGGAVTVRVARLTPGPSCLQAQVVTYPADVATVPRTDQNVQFQAEDRTAPC